MAKKIPAVQLKRIRKKYSLRHAKPTLTDFFTNNTYQKKQFNVFEEFNLTIYKGEKVGVVGRNGAGKTTLLKIISGITTPNSGSVLVNGKVISLIGLTAGFHMDLTGEENIFLNGTVIGMKHYEIEASYPDIVNFADIGQFIKQPMYTYSDGMLLRLGFSIAIHSKPNILLMDEGFSMGDENFREKAEKKFEELSKDDVTIIIVSHWLEYLKKHTDRVISLG